MVVQIEGNKIGTGTFCIPRHTAPTGCEGLLDWLKRCTRVCVIKQEDKKTQSEGTERRNNKIAIKIMATRHLHTDGMLQFIQLIVPTDELLANTNTAKRLTRRFSEQSSSPYTDCRLERG